MKRRFLKAFLGHFAFGNPNWFILLRLRATPSIKGTIVDVETTGLDPTDHIITLGTYSGDTIEIRQLTRPHYDRFKQLCVQVVERKPTPLYAYFAHFEQDFLNLRGRWTDLGQWKSSDWHDGDWPQRDIRLRLTDITLTPCKDPDIDGSEVPDYWQKWLKHKRRGSLAEIAWHCYIDLLREAQLVTKQGS